MSTALTALVPLLLGLFEVAGSFAILGWWAVEWASHGKSALLTYGPSHLFAELLTFLLLLLGGFFLLLGEPGGRALAGVGLGLMLYATVNAFGRIGRRSGTYGLVMVAEAVLCIIFIGLLATGY